MLIRSLRGALRGRCFLCDMSGTVTVVDMKIWSTIMAGNENREDRR